MLNYSQEQHERLQKTPVYQKSVKAFYRADVFCRKSGKNAQLAVKKHQLRKTKKTFGVDYLTLLENEASHEQLDQCLREGHLQVGMLQKDIQKLRSEKKGLDLWLQDKLARIGGKAPMPMTPPSSSLGGALTQTNRTTIATLTYPNMTDKWDTA